MAKGYKGETCSDAIRALFADRTTLSASTIFTQVKQSGPWKDQTIWQHMMALIVDLPPARHHWKNARPFLFLRPDGQLELYDDREHPEVIE